MLKRSIPMLAILAATCCTMAQAADSDDELRAQLERRMARAAALADRAVTEGGAGVPAIQLDNLPVPALESAPIDIEALVQQYSEALTPPPTTTPALLAFVSLSMPDASLLRLVADAERSGVTLVMRGLVDSSIQQTMARVAELIGTHQVAWVIDPEAFTRFNITTVPSYVLVRAGVTTSQCDAGTCVADGDFVRLAGDVAIGYAMERIEVGAPAFAEAARHFRRAGTR